MVIGADPEHLVAGRQLGAAVVAHVVHPPGKPGLGAGLAHPAAKLVGVGDDGLELQLPVRPAHRRMASSTWSVAERSWNTACGPHAASSSTE